MMCFSVSKCLPVVWYTATVLHREGGCLDECLCEIFLVRRLMHYVLH